MSKQLKTLMKEQTQARFQGVEGGVLINAMALNSEQTYAFRKAMHARKLHYTVIKNQVAKQAFIAHGYKGNDLDKVLVGPIGVVYNADEGSAVAAAKAVFEWKRETRDKAVEWKGALVDGAVVLAKDAEALRNAPGKREVRAMLAGALQAPIVKFAATLKETYARLAYAVDAVQKKREGGEGGDAGAPAA